MAADRFAWGDAELIPEGKAERDQMTSRAMDNFLRSGSRRNQRDGDAKNG